MMPAVALVRVPGWGRRVEIPVALLGLWPLVPVCLGLAGIMGRKRPEEAAILRTAVQMFRHARGLTVDVDTADDKHVHIRFV